MKRIFLPILFCLYSWTVFSGELHEKVKVMPIKEVYDLLSTTPNRLFELDENGQTVLSIIVSTKQFRDSPYGYSDGWTYLLRLMVLKKCSVPLEDLVQHLDLLFSEKVAPIRIPGSKWFELIQKFQTWPEN